MTLPVILGFAALLFLALLALLWSRWPAWFKGMLVLGVTVLYFYGSSVVGDIWGWPSNDELPERFVLLAAVIDEPNAKHAGGLYVWVSTLQDGHAAPQPRAFRLPYSKEMHLQLSEGTQKLRAGIAQMGIAERRSPPSGVQWMRAGNEGQAIRLRDLPGPQLPEK
jgi:hypothetical protein